MLYFFALFSQAYSSHPNIYYRAELYCTPSPPLYQSYATNDPAAPTGLYFYCISVHFPSFQHLSSPIFTLPSYNEKASLRWTFSTGWETGDIVQKTPCSAR
jgi:hypothetical protein